MDLARTTKPAEEYRHAKKAMIHVLRVRANERLNAETLVYDIAHKDAITAFLLVFPGFRMPVLLPESYWCFRDGEGAGGACRVRPGFTWYK